MAYNEDEYLALSGIQHFVFCPRQWALIHIEQLWAENLLTIEGDIMHEKAHDREAVECRNGIITVRSLPVSSPSLGFSGECDVVEFIRDDTGGVTLIGQTGKYCAIPVEYKHGSPKENDADILQLTAQAMCLEEMLCCEIPTGYLFYGKTRRRLRVDFDLQMHEKVKLMSAEMHKYFKRKYTPRVKRSKSCNACSLKDLCLPSLEKNNSVEKYIENRLTADGGEVEA